MTTAAMGFLGVVSVLAAVSAWIAELGLRRIGAPGRWVWVLGLAFGPVLLAWAVLAPSSGSSVVAGAIPTVWFELPPLVVGPESGWGDSLAEALAVVWLTLSGTAAAAVLWARAVLARAGRGWRVEHVLGHTVRVAPDLGPAVAGVVRPRIVLPEWALGLPEEHLRLVLAHEEEHVRAGDPPLLAAALTLVIGTAWNPLSWWMLARLRRAVEIDCDGRVLRAGGDVRRYGASLLTVAARAGRSPMALAAFTERSHNLERRILAMTTSTSPRRRLIGAVSLAAALLVAAQACGVDSPVSQGEAAADLPSASTVPVELAAEPTFTPFTTAPEIINRDEVIRTMSSVYPPLLREAGIGGTVRVYFLIDGEGRVVERRLDISSGHEALDRAALEVAGVYRFRPALNRDRAVPVWVSFPITFQVR